MIRRLMAIFAHPDDESCGPGGTLALYASRGVSTILVCATRGELGGEPGPDKRPDDRLAEVRERELRAACRALGIQTCLALHYPDGRLAEWLAPLRADLTRLMRRYRPQVVLTFDPEAPVGGADHQAVGRAATDSFWEAAGSGCCDPAESCNLRPHAARRLYYWLTRPCCGEVPLPAGAPVVTVDVSASLGRGAAALACHRSQAACCAQATARLSEPEEAFERFRLAAARVPLPQPSSGDLFAGIQGDG